MQTVFSLHTTVHLNSGDPREWLSPLAWSAIVNCSQNPSIMSMAILDRSCHWGILTLRDRNDHTQVPAVPGDLFAQDNAS